MRVWFITLLVGATSVLVAAAGNCAPLGSSLDWQALETEHFEVIFPAELIALAEEAAPIAEKAYEFWSHQLRYAPPEKTYIVLVDRSDVSRASVSIFPQNLIVIDHPFGWSDERWSSPSASWLEDILFAEYGRIVDQTRVNGIASDLHALLGKIVAPGLLRPLLVREGVDARIPGDHSFDEMAIRAMAGAQRFPTLAQLSSSYENRTWPATYLAAHAVGSQFLRYLGETQDEEGLQKISRLNSWILAMDPSPQKLYQGFQIWAEKRFTQVQQEIEAQGGITPRTPLNSLSFLSEWAAWSPAGDAIVYRHADPQRLSGLRWIRPDGADDHALLECECGPPAWLNATTLIYPKLEVTQGALLYDLYRYDLESHKEERLTYGERIYSAEPFPGGQRLLMARNGREGQSSLVVFDLANRSRLILKEFNSEERIHSMALSPDGKWIALSLWKKGQGQDLYWMNSEGGELTSLTQDRALEFDPVFSAEGNFLLFSSNRDGISDIYALRLGDRQVFRVTRSLTGSFDPALSPDGQQILFAGYGLDGFSLYGAKYEPNRWSAAHPEGSSTPFSPPQPVARDEKPILAKPVPYDPGPPLVPSFWLPLVGLNHVGIFTRGEDPLGRHLYEISVGMGWDPPQFFYEIDYENRQTLPMLHLRLQGSPTFERQEFGLAFPLGGSLNQERVLTLGLGQERGLTELFLNEKLLDVRGFDLFRRDSSLAIEGALGWLSGASTRRLALDWREELQLPLESPAGPHQFLFRLGAAWSDREAFRLGGVTGRYPLRGYEDVVWGSELISTSIEYRFPIWAIEWGCCGESVWPLFLHDLRGSLFLDGGSAGATLELDHIRVAFGIELQLRLVLGYGLTEGWVRFGFAYRPDAKQPQVYFALGPSF